MSTQDNAQKKYKFEIICVDSDKKSSIHSHKQLLHSIASNSHIINDVEIKNNTLKDTITNLLFEVIMNEESTIIWNMFSIKVSWNYETLEARRLLIVKHLNNIWFNNIYITTDTISLDISQKIYPFIWEIENLIREYLIKFFITKVWLNWWWVTADSEMTKKTSQRKNNETVFKDYIDNKIYLIDFSDLGKMVYSQSSWFIDKESIIDRILKLEDSPSPDIIKNLKTEVDSNYNKFFKDSFRDKWFQEKWEKLERIRHKVAHNNIFISQDLTEAKLLYDNLKEIITTANNNIPWINFSQYEVEKIQDTIASNPYLDKSELKQISKSELLEKLEGCEKWAHEQRDWFLSLKHFVVNYLWSAWYDWSVTNEIISILAEEWKIELYDYKSDLNEYPIKALKRI